MAVIRRFQPRPVRPVSAVGRRAPARRRPRWWRDALGFALPVLALVLAGLFGLTEEVCSVLGARLRRCLAAALVGDAEGEVTAFPRGASGFWG